MVSYEQALDTQRELDLSRFCRSEHFVYEWNLPNTPKPQKWGADAEDIFAMEGPFNAIQKRKHIVVTGVGGNQFEAIRQGLVKLVDGMDKRGYQCGLIPDQKNMQYVVQGANVYCTMSTTIYLLEAPEQHAQRDKK